MDQAHAQEYVSPFSARYASPEMSKLFSAQFKISTFRKLWASLAKAEQKLGLPITHQQVAELEDNVDKIDFALAHSYEKRFRHDVMAHIHAFGDQCPKAKPIIHLGATSCFVTDNTDLIQLKQAMQLVLNKLIHVLRILSRFANEEAASICLAFTHYQPAQPTTIGKRACLWLQDLLMDAKDLERLIEELPFLGAKGATGTQASFINLFNGNESKVKELEALLARDFGFKRTLEISGQTYTRKIDLNILNALESFAATTHKIGTDIRLLAHDHELSESFTDTQVGSSAMPFKRNPIYSERICGIARFVMSLAQNPAATLSTQWLERSLDDSSNRRLCIPESFLGVDAILNLLTHVIENLSANRDTALLHTQNHLPNLAMENVIMQAVKNGEDRQSVHEKMRRLSGRPLSEIAKELNLDLKSFELDTLIGRAPNQVRTFIKEELKPFLERHKNIEPLPSTVDV